MSANQLALTNFFLIIILPDTNSPPDAFILMIKV